MAKYEIEGAQINGLPKKEQLDGIEAFIIQDAERTKQANLSTIRTFVQPDLSEYAKKKDIPSTEGLLNKSDADGYYQAKGSYATTTQLDTKLDTSTYNSDKATFATKAEVNAKLSGTGITSVQVVTELPVSPSETTMYVVVPSDEESTL